MINEGGMGENQIKPEKESIRERKIEELKAKISAINIELIDVYKEINSCPAKIVESLLNSIPEEEKINKERLNTLRKQKEDLEKEREKYSEELKNL